MKSATVFLGEMTNPEVEAFLEKHHTVIIPTGATEQHGPHAPLLTDVLIPQEIARRVAPQIGALGSGQLGFFDLKRLGPEAEGADSASGSEVCRLRNERGLAA